MAEFRIHGDNIVECERALEYIYAALGKDGISLVGPSKSITCPEWVIETSEGSHTITMLPGYGAARWNDDILDYVRAAGGRLREAADAVITLVQKELERPLLAFEFCAALPAGNQAWQRQGRAYSFAHASIPYFYVAELGGFELNSDRGQIAGRLPNPTVPFSFLVTSKLRGSVCLPVYQANSGADPAVTATFGSTFGTEDFLAFIRARLFGGDESAAVAKLEAKCAALISVLTKKRRTNDGLTSEQWDRLIGAINSGTPTTTYLNKIPAIAWRKKVSIPLTSTMKLLFEKSRTSTQGLTSASIPLSYVPASKRPNFATELASIYGDLTPGAVQWLGNTSRDLAIAWVAGFKPGGDDARPDRGLPPLARMLAGDEADLLSVVYGPAKAKQWQTLKADPGKVILSNGLWEAIAGVSDAILCDSLTMPSGSPRLLKRNHWHIATALQPRSILVQPVVRRFGEQDVDTALHSLFVGMGPEIILEGMCNPPGGDWSGITFAWELGQEHRWLTLPRVSQVGAKRPDHVFAVYGLGEGPVCLSVESKEKGGSLEADIGPRLCRYTTALFATPPSVGRTQGGAWSSHIGGWLARPSKYASVGAFLAEAGSDPFRGVRSDTNLDILIALKFRDNGTRADLFVRSLSDRGGDLVSHIRGPLQASPLVGELNVQ